MTGAVLLYDGECGFCSATVQLVLERERKHTLKFAALQSPFAAAVRARHRELEGLDSVVWVEPAQGSQPERTFVRSDAALRVAGYLGGIWRLAAAARIIPRAIRDALYDVVARHRHRLLGQKCFVPGPLQRARFIDS